MGTPFASRSEAQLAVIKDSLEHENLDDYAVKLKNDWGLRKDDMLRVELTATTEAVLTSPEME